MKRNTQRDKRPLIGGSDPEVTSLYVVRFLPSDAVRQVGRFTAAITVVGGQRLV